MKKMIVVAGALALFVAFSASSASAKTVLCEAPEATCAAENILPSGSAMAGYIETELSLTTKALFIGTVKCTNGLFGAKSTAESGNPLPGLSESSSLICSSGPCFKPEISFKSSAPVTMAATGDGKATVTFGNSKEHQSVIIKCPAAGISSTYGAASIPFQFDSDTATLTATNVPLTWESGNKLGGENPVTLNAGLGVVGGFPAAS